MDGFYYVVGNLCGLATPLTTVNPDTTHGRFIDIVIAVWSLSIAAAFIGVVSGMAFLGTLVRQRRSRAHCGTDRYVG